MLKGDAMTQTRALAAVLGVLLVTACGDGDDYPHDGGDANDAGSVDAGAGVGLRFVSGTPVIMHAPKDDADPSTPGFQVDVSVEPTVADASGYGPVKFVLNSKVQGDPIPLDNGKAGLRLTLSVGTKGSNTLNFISAGATRQGMKDADVAWVITVRASE